MPSMGPAEKVTLLYSTNLARFENTNRPGLRNEKKILKLSDFYICHYKVMTIHEVLCGIDIIKCK